MNHVILVGKLSQEPVCDVSEKGRKRTIVYVAVPRGFKNSEGKYETDFFRCVLWNAMASAAKDYCHVGDTIGIKGRIQNKSYVAENNETKYITEVIAERVSFLAPAKKNQSDTTTDNKEDEIVDCF